MRKSGPLTDAAVRRAQPGQKLSDNIGERGRGRLLLVVTAAGKKTWHYRQQTAQGDTTRKLGEYPAMTLSEARKAMESFAIKPEAMKRFGTFGELLDAYTKSLEARNAPTAKDTFGELKRTVPLDSPLRKREARSITIDDIHQILAHRHQGRITSEGEQKFVTTRVNRARALLHAAFNYASKHNYDPRKLINESTKFRIDANPVVGYKLVAEWERTRERVLTQAEMRSFYQHMVSERRVSMGMRHRVEII